MAGELEAEEIRHGPGWEEGGAEGDEVVAGEDAVGGGDWELDGERGGPVGRVAADETFVEADLAGHDDAAAAEKVGVAKGPILGRALVIKDGEQEHLALVPPRGWVGRTS